LLELIFHLIFYDHVFEAKIQKNTFSVSFFLSVYFRLFAWLMSFMLLGNYLKSNQQVANLFLPWCEECPHSIF